MNRDKEIFLILFTIMFVIFLFTSDGHRFSIDETYPQDQAKVIVTMKPHPLFVEGESRMLFQYPIMFPPEFTSDSPPCTNHFLCFPTNLGHTITELPFVFINHHFGIIDRNTVVWTDEDFDDPHYIWWRNSLDPDFTFMELLYGPLFSSLTVGVFYLLCRSFSFSPKNSVILAIIYGLSTILWAYSQTSMNNGIVTFFVLLGLFFFRKFQLNKSTTSLILSGITFGFSLLVRPDSMLYIIPVFGFLLLELKEQKNKIRKFLSYILPVSFFYILYLMIPTIRFGDRSAELVAQSQSVVLRIGSETSILEGGLGSLFSPGIGILVFAPILWTLFFSFPEFFRQNKRECFLFISIISLFIVFYGTAFEFWQGYVAWGARYLLPIVPLLLLPLGASMEQRKNKFLVILLILAAVGFFINLVYVLQDQSWFVWSQPGSTEGLFGLCKDVRCPLYIHPAITWTFQYSQLTWSINELFTHFQPDIFLLKLLGTKNYFVLLTLLLIPLSYILKRIITGFQEDIEKKRNVTKLKEF